MKNEIEIYASKEEAKMIIFQEEKEEEYKNPFKFLVTCLGITLTVLLYVI